MSTAAAELLGVSAPDKEAAKARHEQERLATLGAEAERKRQEKEAKKADQAREARKRHEAAGRAAEEKQKQQEAEAAQKEQKTKDAQQRYGEAREHRRLAAERREEIKQAQAKRDSGETDSSKFNIFGVYFFPWILLVLAIIQVRQLPKPSPQDTSTEQNERKLVYAQTLLSSLMVLAASQRANSGIRSHVPAILALFLVVASGMGAGMSSNSTIQGISGGTCALAICTGIAFHRHGTQGAPGWAITKVAYNLLEQIEAMPGINVIVLAGLLFWTIMQMADLKFAYPSTDAKVEVWYPDEQKPKTSEYKAARALELVLVSLIFIATFAKANKDAHWLTKLPEQISRVVGTPGRRNMVLILLLAFCGVYMFIYNGYESFAIDSALLGLALVSSSSYTMAY